MPAPRRVGPALAPHRAGLAAALLALAACAPRTAPVAAAPAAPTAAAPRVVPAPDPAPERAAAWAVVAPVEGAEHYVDQLLEAEKGRVTRWERSPGDTIRLWAPPPPVEPGRDLGAVLARAMVLWNDVGLPVRFARVADSARADVRVRWVRTDREADVAGRARLRIAGGTDRIVSATVALATHMPSGYPFPESAALGHALHELGHVLGIQHTGRHDCVMFFIPQRAALCPADAETARRWYALPTGLVSAAESRR